MVTMCDIDLVPPLMGECGCQNSVVGWWASPLFRLGFLIKSLCFPKLFLQPGRLELPEPQMRTSGDKRNHLLQLGTAARTTILVVCVEKVVSIEVDTRSLEGINWFSARRTGHGNTFSAEQEQTLLVQLAHGMRRRR